MFTFQSQQNEGIQMGYLEDFEAALINQDPPALLRLWEEYTSSEAIDPTDLKSVLQLIKNSQVADFIGRHIERVLPYWYKFEKNELTFEILKLIIDLQMTNNDTVRQLAFEYLENTYKNDPHYQEKMRLIGLKGRNEDFRGAITNYELLNHLKKSNYVYHTAGWGVGEVMDISFLREQAVFEFDFVAGRKEISFKNALKCLLAIPENHFLALRFGNPDVLEQKAKEDPVEVIHMLLRDLGAKTAGEIKDELCELVIPAKDWTKWWQAARGKIKKHTWIQTPEELSKPFRLMKKEISHEETLQKALEHKPDANTLIQMVYQFLKDYPEILKNSAFKQTLQNKLTEALAFPEITVAQKFQFYFILQDLGDEKEFGPILDLIKHQDNFEEIVKEMSIHSLKKRLLVEIRKARQDWKEIFSKMLFIVDQSTLRDYVLTELLGKESEENVKKLIEQLCVHPSKYPETFVWYFQKIITDDSLPYSDKQGKGRFFESFLILLNYVEQAGQRELVKRMHVILSADRYAIVRKIMKDSSVKDVQEFLLLTTKCHSLSDHDIKILHSLAEVAHPSLAKKTKKSTQEETEDLIIWTSQEGYLKLQKRIEQIATVETVENAKEIEIARSHGDLRENAEFKSALERRDRLQAELKFLSDQMNKCRVLTKEDISLDKVSVGTAVDCQKKNGQKTTFTLLGPWDADPEKGILSFQSKLAKAMTGLKVGDSFQVQGEEYKITGIKLAI